MQNKRYGDFWKEVGSQKSGCTQTTRETMDGFDIADLLATKSSAMNGRNNKLTLDMLNKGIKNIEGNIWVQ